MTTRRPLLPPASAGNAAGKEWLLSLARDWDRFWFSPADPATLGLIRILAGTMLFYTHLVWTIDLEGFFGHDGWLSPDFVHRFYDSPYAWSHLFLTENTTALYVMHAAALLIFCCLTVGLWTRVTSLLSFLLAVSYAHRGGGSMYGLDQINVMLAFYLAVGPSGGAYSIDEWRRSGREGGNGVRPSISANIALRLIQLHMCVIYLFAGLSKLRGDSWWDGTALWGAFANYEYQTIDLARTMAGSIVLVNTLTHVTIAWEIAYAALVWPRRTRPLMLALSVPLHLGIAFCMGMITFGVIMIVGNVAFVSPRLVRRVIDRGVLGRRQASDKLPATRTAGAELAAPRTHPQAAVLQPGRRDG